ncbi:MAG: response regulator transcription factor [Bacteroidota bacterium]
MSTISVILADAEYLIRLGLLSIFKNSEEVQVIGEVANEEELLALLRMEPADVVVMDYNQPGNFTLDAIRAIRNGFPKTRILVVSADNDKNTIYEVLELGVTAFLTKSCDRDEIIEGVKAAAKSQRYFCKKVMDYVFERSFSPTVEDCSPMPLTVREIEIVQLTAQGLIAKEIANRLNLSTHTVYTHRKNIMRKLKINTSSELILYAVNKGLIK